MCVCGFFGGGGVVLVLGVVVVLGGCLFFSIKGRSKMVTS